MTYEKNNPKKDSTLNSGTGRYVLGGTTEASAYALEWWEKKKLDKDPTDLIYVVEKKHNGRPDLIAHTFYSEMIPNATLLFWVICQYNAILDPFQEITEGVVLRLPHPTRLKTWLRKDIQSGGVASTRIVRNG